MIKYINLSIYIFYIILLFGITNIICEGFFELGVFASLYLIHENS